jgi:hypothetical protein
MYKLFKTQYEKFIYKYLIKYEGDKVYTITYLESQQHCQFLQKVHS